VAATKVGVSVTAECPHARVIGAGAPECDVVFVVVVGVDPSSVVGSAGGEGASDALGREPAKVRVDVVGGEGAVVGEPPDEQRHAGAAHELDGRLQQGRVALIFRELGPEVFADDVRDAVAQDASNQIGSAFPREGLPEVSVPFDVPKHDAQRLEELAACSRGMVGRLPFRRQGRTDVLEPAEEEIFFVAVVRVEGRSPYVGPVEDVLDGDPLIALLGDEREQCVVQERSRAPYPPIRRWVARHRVRLPNSRARSVRLRTERGRLVVDTRPEPSG
jgi:hypothetical protein